MNNIGLYQLGNWGIGMTLVNAQIDEKQIAMIPLAIDPAGNPNGLADMFGPELTTGMGTISVHGKASAV